MTVRKALLTPFTRAPAVELAKDSRIFRKQVLRSGVFAHPATGEKLEFTDRYLDELARAFDQKAFDAVNLMFAPADNRHTKAIEDVRGEVLGFERGPDGLDAIVRAANDDAARVLRENPQIGVSLGIEPDYVRSDGKRWNAAVHHVLATIDPVITGMSPWESIELGRPGDEHEVLDLSALEFGRDDRQADDSEEIDMTGPSQGAGGGQLTPDELAAFRQLIAQQSGDQGGDRNPVYGEYQPPTDDEIAEIAAGLLDDEDDEDDTENEPGYADAGVQLSRTGRPSTVRLAREDREALELAQQRGDEQSIELARIRSERDEARWNGLITELTGPEFGVAPAVLKVDGLKGLMLSRRPIQLSNGADVDPALVLENVIKTMARSRALDLSRGDVFPVDESEDAAANRKQVADDARDYAKTFGLV